MSQRNETRLSTVGAKAHLESVHSNREAESRRRGHPNQNPPRLPAKFDPPIVLA